MPCSVRRLPFKICAGKPPNTRRQEGGARGGLLRVRGAECERRESSAWRCRSARRSWRLASRSATSPAAASNPATGLVAGGRVSGNSAAGYIIAKDRRHPEYPPLASSAAASPAGCSRSSAPEGAALRASCAAARQLGRLAPRFGARLGPIPCAAPEVRVSGTCNLRQTMPSTRHSGRRGIVT
jgi:hypothetical protein